VDTNNQANPGDAMRVNNTLRKEPVKEGKWFREGKQPDGKNDKGGRQDGGVRKEAEVKKPRSLSR